MSVLLLFAVLLASSYIAILWAKWHAVASVETSYSKGEVQNAVGTAWAWLDYRQVEEVMFTWGGQDLSAMQSLTRPQANKLYLPHIAITVGAIIFYQSILRGGGPFVSGPCPAAPNCSSFLVGALRRYGYLEACSRSYLRVLNCDKTRPISFTEDFRT
jgi:putative component of membrane protein insertase Oxa1/YidC/SpoIIIJ protein YidD